MRYRDYRHWVVAVFLEHMVLFFRFTVKGIVGSEPDWVKDAKEQLEGSIRLRMRMETTEEKDAKMVQVEQHRARISFGGGSGVLAKMTHMAVKRAGRTMPTALRKDLVAMFYEIDSENDGTVNQEELVIAAQAGTVPEEVVRIAAEDDDGMLTLSEWLVAWERSAEVLKYELTQFKNDGSGTNHPDGHLVLPVTLHAAQRKRVPELCAQLGLGLREQGVGSATTLTVVRSGPLAEAAAARLNGSDAAADAAPESAENI